MVIRNKIYRMIVAYRSLLRTREKQIVAIGGIKIRGLKNVKKGNKTKNRILNFYLINSKWPSRTGRSNRERQLGTCFENFISKESAAYDSHLRRLVLATGRKSNHKRKHNVNGFKNEIVAFMKAHGHVPRTAGGAEIKGEDNLRRKLDYYTKAKKDRRFLGVVYSHDKFHLSGILTKYRPFLNKNTNLKKPLIRVVR